MFGIGSWELIIILLLVLVFLGPKRLPSLAQSLGKGLREFRNAQREFKNNLEIAADDSNDHNTPSDSPDSPPPDTKNQKH